ncbi:unnamed protein product, partial [Sphenostylis stenocarpa]
MHVPRLPPYNSESLKSISRIWERKFSEISATSLPLKDKKHSRQQHIKTLYFRFD